MKSRKYKSYSIAGHDFKIKYQKNINSENALGLCKFYENEIFVRTEFEGRSLPNNQLNQTLWHEVFHSILHVLNRHDLNSDEDFVDSVSQLLWQYDKSRK